MEFKKKSCSHYGQRDTKKIDGTSKQELKLGDTRPAVNKVYVNI